MKVVQLKAVIFDLGDTLILTDKWNYDKCLKKLLKSLQNDGVIISIPFEEFRHVYFEVRRRMYLESAQSLREIDFCLRIAETVKRFDYDFNQEDPIITRAVEAFLDAFIEDVRMEDYVPLLLTELKEKYKLGLVSNFAYAPGLWKILHRFNLARFFDAVVVSGELGVRKPHPVIFKEVLRTLGVRAVNAVLVGDSLKADINGAKRVGLKAILVENVGLRKNPYAIPGELDSFPVEPEVTIPNLKSLRKILKVL